LQLDCKYLLLFLDVLWHVNALPGNGLINTAWYTHATTEQRGYATRFWATAR
jgi:hypothetical protein